MANRMNLALRSQRTLKCIKKHPTVLTLSEKLVQEGVLSEAEVKERSKFINNELQGLMIVEKNLSANQRISLLKDEILL